MKIRKLKQIYIPENYIRMYYEYLIDFMKDFPIKGKGDFYIFCDGAYYVFDHEDCIVYTHELK